jgi:hypothetical protein
MDTKKEQKTTQSHLQKVGWGIFGRLISELAATSDDSANIIHID